MVITSGAQSFPDGDYSIPHRAAPVPGRPHATERGVTPDQASVGAPSERKRRGSGTFGFLRRSLSQSRSRHVPLHISSPEQPAPPLPSPPPVPTSFPPSRLVTGGGAGEGRLSRSSVGRKASNEKRRNMLRKSSRTRAEQERVAREQERAARAPPRLPSHHVLPGIDGVGGDGYGGSDEGMRPDSVAMFNPPLRPHPHHSPPSASSTPPPPLPNAPTNFSRLGAMSVPQSPPYAVRPGNVISHAQIAQHQMGSSPDLRTRTGGSAGHGEYVAYPQERTESMTHRGRYSYASSVNQVNTNSPRRIRRRKDPTPFKCVSPSSLRFCLLRSPFFASLLLADSCSVLVIGAKNSGKTSFISFLRHSLALPSHKQTSPELDASAAQLVPLILYLVLSRE